MLDKPYSLTKKLINTIAVLLCAGCLTQTAYGLPSFARQTGQKCAACHASGSWPQLTPWGRFFKLSGYTAGNKLVDKEGFHYVPVGLLGQVGVTWAQQPNNSLGQPVISPNGSPQGYSFAGEVGTKLTDSIGVFYEYQVGNTFPGWKGSAGPADLRAIHFFHPGGRELLVGIDSNNNPTEQDVWNSTPTWGYPFYGSPQAPGGPGGPMMTRLNQQSGSVGIYALLDRHLYAEVSFYHVATGLFRWMSAGTAFQTGTKNRLDGYNPYWRAYWTNEKGPQSLMVGSFGMRSNIFPNSADPTGITNQFTDYGFDSQYQYLGEIHKVTLRGSYIYENQGWSGSFPLSTSSSLKGNLKSLNLNGSYGYHDHWIFNAAYFSTNGSRNSALYAVADPAGNELTSSPNTSGYVLEVDRPITQNIQATLAYKGFIKYNGLSKNIDGLGPDANANNTLWLTLFFAF